MQSNFGSFAGSLTESSAMDLFDSLEWVISFQNIYRLACFKRDNSIRKLVTSNWQLVCSTVYIILIAIEVGYVGQEAYYGKTENFLQIRNGEF